MAAITVRHSQFGRLFSTQVPCPPFHRRFALTAHFGEAGDILEIGIAGPGDRVGVNCAVQISDVDTHATPTHTFSLELVSDEATPQVKTIIHEATTGQAGGVARSTLAPSVEDGVGFIVPATRGVNWQYRLICDAAAATQAAAGVVNVFLDVISYRDSDSGLTE